MKTRKAIFLDRDGTLIIDKNYLSRVDEMEYFPDTLKALLTFQELDYEIFVVTNQSGVGRGYFSLDAVDIIHRQLQIDLTQNKLKPFLDFAVCPHSPDDHCECRKPSGKMVLDLMNKHHIDPTKSYMVGDKIIDAECGKNAGISGVIVRTKLKTDFLSFKNLLDFAHHLKSNE